MPKKHSPGCGCCSCLDRSIFEDDFSTDKTGWDYTSFIFTRDLARESLAFVPGSIPNSGSYYRTVTTGATDNLRIKVRASVRELNFATADPCSTEIGIFVGGICSVYWRDESLTNVGQYRVYVGLGVDQFGQNPTTVIPLGLAPANANRTLSIWIESDWLNAGRFFIQLVGGTAFLSQGHQYATEVVTSFGSTFNVGMFGNNMIGRPLWDDYWLHKSNKANGRCVSCMGCKANEDLPKEILLSVAGCTNDFCDCEQLNGDWVLYFAPIFNYSGCAYITDCAWAAPLTTRCGGEILEPCEPGHIWEIFNGHLFSTSSINILDYAITGTFDCSPGAVNTWHNVNDVGEDGGCTTFPATLTTINN
jgi:hypothetical protein